MIDFVGVGFSVVGALALALLILLIVQVWRSPELNETERVVWILAMIFFPVIAVLVWFLAGPHPFGLRITRDIR
jgi:hypothetical protein